jgi:hypothetical protein
MRVHVRQKFPLIIAHSTPCFCPESLATSLGTCANGFTDVAKHYGSNLTKEGLKTRYHRFIKPDADLLAQAVRSGVDAKNVVLSCDGKIYDFPHPITFLSPAHYTFYFIYSILY